MTRQPYTFSPLSPIAATQPLHRRKLLPGTNLLTVSVTHTPTAWYFVVRKSDREGQLERRISENNGYDIH